VASYDAKLADAVLKIVDEAFPNVVQIMDIKHRLNDELSDDALLTALDALILQRFIEGKSLREHTSGQRKLAVLANIQITAEGHQRASGQIQSSGQTVHQFINYGQAGAMGHHATGVINYQQQWSDIASQTDFKTLVSELERLRIHLQQNAVSRSDYQQMGLVANAEEYAEKQDGSKVLEVLSKAGTGLLEMAKDIGSDIAAKVIAKAVGLEP